MADDADKASAAVEHLTFAALQRHRMAALNPTKPSTGICCDCRLEIEPERLAAVPDAERCSECATDAEHDARRRAMNGR